MGMIRVSEAAERWGVTSRYVQMLCKEGRIPGAMQWGRTWMIPEEAVYRRDSAVGEVSGETDIARGHEIFNRVKHAYVATGTADACTAEVSDSRDSKMIMEAGFAYLRGEIDSSAVISREILDTSDNFQCKVSAGMRLGLCAVWKGDIDMWNEGIQAICDASRKEPDDSEETNAIADLALASINGSIHDTSQFPAWFRIGCFDRLPPDLMASAKVLYAKYLYSTAYAIASRQLDVPGVSGITPIELLPYILEPMISQARADRSIIAEISLRALCAVVYHYVGRDSDAVRHLDRAIELAIPDRLYGILAEYYRGLDKLLEDRLGGVDPQAAARVRELYDMRKQGWSRINAIILKRHVASNLTMREREVARLAAFGFTNPEIAQKLSISLAAVKQTIRNAMYKGGVEKRSQLAEIL